MRLKRHLLPAAVLAALALAIVLVPDVSAQFGLNEAATPAGLKNPGIPAIIGGILKALLGFVGTLFLIMMIYSGFLWMTARGDAKKVDQAKQLITGAIIGIVIIAASYAITDFVIKAATGAAKTTTGTGTETPGTGTSTIGTKQKGEACTSGSDCAAPNICDIGGTNTCI